MHTRLTNRSLTAFVNSTQRAVFLRDTILPGFGAKVTATGQKSWIVEARVKGGKSRRIKLGDFPAVKAVEARAMALEKLSQLSTGIDPVRQSRDAAAESRRQEAKAQVTNITLQETLDEYLATRELKPKTARDYANTLKNCYGDWLDKPLPSITREDVLKRHRRIGKTQGKKTQAQKARAILSGLFKFAAGRYTIDDRKVIENPVKVITDTGAGYRLAPRKRALNPEQLFLTMRAAITECDPTVRDFMFLLVLTGLRDKEAKELRWESVDWLEKTFTIKNTKNRTDHTLPMFGTTYVMLLSRWEERPADCPWVFPSKTGKGPIRDTRKQFAKIVSKTGFKFTAHDLRHTFSTFLHHLEVGKITITRLMNHSETSVTERYIKTSPRDHVAVIAKIHDFIASGHDWTSDDGFNALSDAIASGEEVMTWEALTQALYSVTYGYPLPDAIMSNPRVDFQNIERDFDLISGSITAPNS